LPHASRYGKIPAQRIEQRAASDEEERLETLNCPECGADNAPQTQFCGQCGAEIVTGGSVDHAERRAVTKELGRAKKLIDTARVIYRVLASIAALLVVLMAFVTASAGRSVENVIVAVASCCVALLLAFAASGLRQRPGPWSMIVAGFYVLNTIITLVMSWPNLNAGSFFGVAVALTCVYFAWQLAPLGAVIAKYPHLWNTGSKRASTPAAARRRKPAARALPAWFGVLPFSIVAIGGLVAVIGSKPQTLVEPKPVLLEAVYDEPSVDPIIEPSELILDENLATVVARFASAWSRGKIEDVVSEFPGGRRGAVRELLADPKNSRDWGTDLPALRLTAAEFTDDTHAVADFEFIGGSLRVSFVVLDDAWIANDIEIQ
jgi:hypothetical protein